jgi:signal transduction histidine kinase
MNPVDFLGKIVEVCGSNLEIWARVNSVVNTIAQDLMFDEVLVFIQDKDKKLTCRFKNQKSLLFPLLSRYRCLIGEGIVGSVAQKRVPQYYSIKDIPPRFGCLFYPQLDAVLGRYRSFSFLPISDDSYLYGVLLLVSGSREKTHDPEKILLSIASRELSGVMRVNELLLSSKKKISELATLSELGKALSSNAAPEAVLNNIALIIARALNVTGAVIGLAHGPLGVACRQFLYGTIDPDVEPRLQALEKRARELKKDVSEKEITENEHGTGTGYLIQATPILSKETMLGTVSIYRRVSAQDEADNGNDRYALKNIANYIASGLENLFLNIKLKEIVKELNEAQKRIVEQEKFRSLGEMTANIAHEIKNPLVIIGGFTKRLAKKVQLNQAEHKYTSIILKEVSRLEVILNEILDYVKDSEAAAETCQINDCLDETLYLLTSDATWNRLQIVKEYDRSLPAVHCDPRQLKQVFINILVNAFDAMNGEGTITVRTEAADLKGQSAVAVSLADTGTGLDPMILDDIFNPFFTTKERGTGLGLAISNKIVMNHRGRIDVRNMPGRGATFIVYLPAQNNTIKEGQA